VRFEGAGKRFGDGPPVLADIGLAVEPGEFEGRLVKPFKVDELIALLRPFLA